MEIKERLKRKRKSEMELKLLSSIMTEHVTDRKDGADIVREASSEERLVLKRIAYGALLTLNDSEYLAGPKETERAVILAAESVANQFLPELNTYDTVYLPLESIIRQWERVISE